MISSCGNRLQGGHGQDNHVLNCDELRPWLRPVSQFCHDYMRGMASGGCLNVAISLC